MSEANDFNSFTEESNLHEYSLKGHRFTFVAGDKLSRIDRVLVNWNFFSAWPLAEYIALDRKWSDHSPLILKTMCRNFGPKPFRFFNSWLERQDFSGLVKDALINTNVQGALDTCLMLKFKRLRSLISDWARNSFDKERGERLLSEQELVHLDGLIEERQLLEEEVWSLEEIKRRLRELEIFRQRDLKQKARSNWASFGDDNTRFFHGCINKRKASNYISGLMVFGVWETKPEIVKREVLRFYRSKFKKKMVVRPKFDCYGLKKLETSDADRLIQCFSIQ
ncbi:uncharacterized protein LOC110867073 [Helianthus annuus]|uniref:uncharacterized protein LOC110867073 n=1 Tax=Helianthus annuus TaxID=4232 RepID=UPI000B906F62|nr:uncharacterized protein LOC110867073 [Helianthus annuus]